MISLFKKKPMAVSTESGKAEKALKEGWNYDQLILAFFFAFLAQMLFLPCLCDIGEAKVHFALIFDGLIVLRLIVARLLKQKDRGWIFYAILLYSSPLWIELLNRRINGPH